MAAGAHPAELELRAEAESYTYGCPRRVAASPIDVAAVQAALAADGIDGWLLYDFRGLNPIAADVTGGRPSGRSPRDAALVST